MADELLPLAGVRGRHRSPRAVSPRRARMVTAVRNLAVMPHYLRFFAEPFEVMLAFSSLVSGAAAAFSAGPPALSAQLPAWQIHVWGGLLTVGGVLTLCARWRIGRWRADSPSDAGLIAALRLEVSGVGTLAIGVGVYAAGILSNGLVGLQAASLTGAWAASFALRGWIVSRALKGLTGKGGAGGDG